MLHLRWKRKGIAIVAALIVVGGVTASLAIGLATPQRVSSTALGPEWNCSRVALLVTSCTPAPQPPRMIIRVSYGLRV